MHLHQRRACRTAAGTFAATSDCFDPQTLSHCVEDITLIILDSTRWGSGALSSSIQAVLIWDMVSAILHLSLEPPDSSILVLVCA